LTTHSGLLESSTASSQTGPRDNVGVRGPVTPDRVASPPPYQATGDGDRSGQVLLCNRW
jgi:hypothetical protein